MLILAQKSLQTETVVVACKIRITWAMGHFRSKRRDTVGTLLHIGGSVSNLTECDSEHLFDMLAIRKTEESYWRAFYLNQVLCYYQCCCNHLLSCRCNEHWCSESLQKNLTPTLPEVLTSTP